MFVCEFSSRHLRSQCFALIARRTAWSHVCLIVGGRDVLVHSSWVNASNSWMLNAECWSPINIYRPNPNQHLSEECNRVHLDPTSTIAMLKAECWMLNAECWSPIRLVPTLRGGPARVLRHFVLSSPGFRALCRKKWMNQRSFRRLSMAK